MNKSELVKQIAESADISQNDANKALSSLIETVTTELSEGGRVDLIGFGSFSLKHRNAREGRNPSTGETIQIAAANVPSFKAGKALKESCNA
ncbi:HU family DNA-binding protein (plasmid) [Catenovulum adriaticum]|uniref:HU family DNA-binding protein n=2 Tax=Catenovulum adriaticum TaxID=2984846 RepID=A0ABY7AU46_9ALTE|nr:HU family DNA-binding protein [Catenovulum sp. TS8]WAJ72297.1 HU family DNA-binding protein [Catenovulum sp. TS8]